MTTRTAWAILAGFALALCITLAASGCATGQVQDPAGCTAAVLQHLLDQVPAVQRDIAACSPKVKP